MDKNKFAIEVFDRRANVYQEKYMDVSLYHDSLNLFCNRLGKNASVLDVACGPGNITACIKRQRPDLEVFGIDLSPNMVQLARENNPDAEFAVMDCRKISDIERKTDGIIAGFCLPYLSKEEAVQLIAGASAMLDRGGMLYISTMEDSYSKSGWRASSQGDKLYMYFHEESYLAEALEQNNFTILDISRKRYPGSDGTETTDIIMIAVKK